MPRLSVRITATCAALLTLLGPAGAAPRPPDTLRFNTPKNYTWGELALMPEYCYDVQGELYGAPGGSTGQNDSPRSAKWTALMGQDFWHMHHYCYVLADLIRLQGAGISPNRRNGYYANIERNLDYVLRNSSTSMALYPEVLLRAGDFYMETGRMTEASDAYERARRLKPDYWPAYTRWIDVLVSLKLTAKAKALAEEGLQNAPDAEPLKQAYVKLGGDPAKLPRRAAAASPAASAASAATEATAPAAAASSATGTVATRP